MFYMLSADRIKELNEFINKMNIKKTDLMLLNLALTHPSFNFERSIDTNEDYERLEFLGDSVLGLVMSDYLFEKYPNFDEGKLTKIRSYLVSDEFLFKIAIKIGLNKYLNIGVHEEKDGGRDKQSIVACATEATFGAVYKSLSFEKAKIFILNLYEKMDFDIHEILYMYNSKEILQQYTQSLNKDLPEYKLISETGEAHNKTYSVLVEYHGEELGRGSAKTKKEAEKIAAFNAVKKLKISEEVL